jgi:hypothetical protein
MRECRPLLRRPQLKKRADANNKFDDRITRRTAWSFRLTLTILLCFASTAFAVPENPQRMQYRETERLLWELRLKACQLEEQSLADRLRSENRQSFASEKEFYDLTMSLEQARECRAEAELKVRQSAIIRNGNAKEEPWKTHGEE